LIIGTPKSARDIDIDSFEGLMREAIAEGARNAGRVTGARFAVGLTGKGIT
jgi:hypothetical protein